ncbi:MAG TPA: heterodisulfide reductase [Deltaproteobacteria bacterium]|nr:heterodisulfide reductase [Deltaproteobacteria bacterium]
MRIRLDSAELDGPLVRLLERMSGERFSNCYQCGNCSGGCPVTYEMEIPPSQVIRFLQLGKVDEVLAANSMWVCVGCLQCYSRCPKSVSLAKILEAMRQLSLRRGEDHEPISEVPAAFLKTAPAQALVCGFRKFVS